MAAGDVDAVAELMEKLAVPARRQGRAATLMRWFGWLDDRGGIEGRPMLTVLAVLIYAWLGRPAEAERWADVMDHQRDGDAGRPLDPAVRAWAALARAFMCRNGIAQMLADADEAARKLPAAGAVTSGPALLQGIARVLSGDLHGGDAILADAVSLGKQAGTYEIGAGALAERSLVAMARGEWGQAGDLARQARATLRQARIEDSYVTPLVCAVQAVRPSTAATSRPPTSSWSAPSARGRC
jgi:ATP/maltotriose-dependent transcriptional regulator MalT